MWMKQLKIGLTGLLLFFLVACGTSMPNVATSTYPTVATSDYGVVQSVEVIPRQNAGISAGTLAGAVVGGVLGHQVGQGTGNTAATIAGAAGGALAGQAIERNAAGNDQVYRVSLMMDNGTVQTLIQDTPPNLQMGDRVRIANGLIVERSVR